MRILIAGGGTGGHIYPGIAIAHQLRKAYQAEILFVGKKEGMEFSILEKEGFALHEIDAYGWRRKFFSLQTIRFIFIMIKGLFQSIKCIMKFKPDIVVGMGSYVCAPVVLATLLFRIPVLLHEQNAIPGLTNRVLSRVSNKIAVSFPTSQAFFPKGKVIVTGTPIREEIGKVGKKEARLSLGLEEDCFTLLIFGGSRGAHSINRATVEALPKLERISPKPLQVIYITGAEDYEWVKEKLAGIKLRVKISEYVYDMSKALAAADLAVCRAGATTLAEISACGLPSILIPYPHSAENHQLYNAQHFLQIGAAKVILDKDLTGEVLAKSIIELMESEDELSRMDERSRKFGKVDASWKFCELIRSILE